LCDLFREPSCEDKDERQEKGYAQEAKGNDDQCVLPLEAMQGSDVKGNADASPYLADLIPELGLFAPFFFTEGFFLPLFEAS